MYSMYLIYCPQYYALDKKNNKRALCCSSLRTKYIKIVDKCGAILMNEKFKNTHRTIILCRVSPLITSSF